MKVKDILIALEMMDKDDEVKILIRDQGALRQVPYTSFEYEEDREGIHHVSIVCNWT